ncbi:MAG: hypothetical protein A2Z34_09600 [Planctomycetes bacterium RBG_16_59_8]|nr:MAG: hypothetical protein A2Z34_09600 [Planctomycetes bacterium RBG_16_59_8]
MRVLLAHNRYRIRGGEDRYVDLLFDLLERGGHQVVKLIEDSRKIGSKIAAAKEMFASPEAVRDLRDLLDRGAVDVAHIHNLFPRLSPAILDELKRRRIPVVMTVHNLRLICPVATCFDGEAVCERCCRGNGLSCMVHNCRGRRMESLVYGTAFTHHRRRRVFERCVDRFIVLNGFYREMLTRYGFPAEKIVIQPYMVEGGDGTAERRGERYILFFGRLSREKGVETLLKAAALLPEVAVRIAGSGEDEERLRAICSQRGIANVRFVGYLQGWELSQEIDGAAFVTVPSEWYENFPYSALESLVRGRAVIAAEIGGLPELVQDGVNGLLFKPGDENELAGKIRRLWENPEEARGMGLEGRRLAAQRYAPEEHLRRIEEIYRSVCEESGRR